MSTAIKENLITIREQVARFAEQNIACRDDLHTMDGFPFDIWHKMGQERLLGLNLPETYGGLGGDYLSTVVAGETLVQRGHNMGLALSWLVHLIVSRFLIMGFGNKSQHDEYLRDLASGRITASLAASEKGAGAHPKHLKTSGNRQDDLFVLNGEKTYLTNGPIADLFIVLAITGVDAGRNRFTSFIVPKETEGLSITRQIDFGFLRPSPHCEIKLNDCSVHVSNILGKEGFAYEDMIRPFREIEETCLMGPIVGGMERQIELLVSLIRKQGVNPTDELKSELGELKSLLDTLRIMAYEAGGMVDSDTNHTEFVSLLLSFRKLSGHFQSLFKAIMSKSKVEEDSDLVLITNDLVNTISIAKYVAQIKQRKLGEALLSERDSYEINPQ
ncbi:MAG: acyl-CoA dehydrogenase family protein [Proteobacteria bacterium]|nr:acyl-CoA dehydrogenase family protein [Pseudomonadota bacterium]